MICPSYHSRLPPRWWRKRNFRSRPLRVCSSWVRPALTQNLARHAFCTRVNHCGFLESDQTTTFACSYSLLFFFMIGRGIGLVGSCLELSLTLLAMLDVVGMPKLAFVLNSSHLQSQIYCLNVLLLTQFHWNFMNLFLVSTSFGIQPLMWFTIHTKTKG